MNRFFLILILTLVAIQTFAQDVYIYADKDSPASPYWVPSGFMPDGKGIELTLDCIESPFKGKTCIKLVYLTSANTWGGIYWLPPDGGWNAKGIDISKDLMLKDGDCFRKNH